MIGVYKITSPGGKVYIGQSWNIERRFHEYMRLKNCVGQRKLYNSFLKHGVKNHKFEVIHELPIDIKQEVFDRYEQLYMDLYRDVGIELLNLREGGSTGKLSEETKNKMKNTKSTDESKIRMSEGQKGNKNRLGKKQSEDAKRKMKVIKKGNKYRLHIKHSEKTKLKIRETKRKNKL